MLCINKGLHACRNCGCLWITVNAVSAILRIIFGQFAHDFRVQKMFWKILGNCWKKYWKLLEKILEKYWKLLSKILEKYWKLVRKILENTGISYMKCCGNPAILVISSVPIPMPCNRYRCFLSH